MAFNDLPQIERCYLAIADDHTAINDAAGNIWRGAKYQCRDRIVQGAGEADLAHIEHHDIGRHAGFERTYVVTIQYLGSTKRCDFQRLPGGHCVWPEADPLQQHGLPDFGHHVAGIVGGAAIDTQADRHAGIVEIWIISGVRLAQIGYRLVSQLNSSPFCAAGTARVRL